MSGKSRRDPHPDQKNCTLMIWPAPAKINRFLHITGRRDDGYHLLQTVFQFIDYCDELSFDIRHDTQIRRVTDLAGVTSSADLTVKAAALLQQAAGVRQGVDIHLVKKLPMGGGLGGGSSDAATTLVALNQLWGVNYSVGRLVSLGLQLGADVPVFIRGQAAWAEGVGEHLTPLTLDEPWYLIVVPDVQIATKDIFAVPELTRNSNPITIRDFLTGRAVGNVCESVVCSRYPSVAQALEWLDQFAPARMSGTGSCIFAAFLEQAQAHSILRRLPEHWQGFVAQGKNRSPLLKSLK